MKIYMQTPLQQIVNLENLKKHHKFSNYLQYHFFSKSGMHVQKNNTLYKIEVVDKPIQKSIIGGTIFLIDNSYYKQSLCHSLSMDHICFSTHIFFFYLNSVTCVLEGKINTGEKMIITDMYFVPKMVKDETNPLNGDTIIGINEFLSHLK
tara:strand:- start:1599 stop:2048 length:450 start_codon:yes stop_codon:yes gene_type:complete